MELVGLGNSVACNTATRRCINTILPPDDEHRVARSI